MPVLSLSINSRKEAQNYNSVFVLTDLYKVYGMHQHLTIFCENINVGSEKGSSVNSV